MKRLVFALACVLLSVCLMQTAFAADIYFMHESFDSIISTGDNHWEVVDANAQDIEEGLDGNAARFNTNRAFVATQRIDFYKSGSGASTLISLRFKLNDTIPAENSISFLFNENFDTPIFSINSGNTVSSFGVTSGISALEVGKWYTFLVRVTFDSAVSRYKCATFINRPGADGEYTLQSINAEMTNINGNNPIHFVMQYIGSAVKSITLDDLYVAQVGGSDGLELIGSSVGEGKRADRMAELVLDFNQPINPNVSSGSFSLGGLPSSSYRVSFKDGDFRKVMLKMLTPLDRNADYELGISSLYTAQYLDAGKTGPSLTGEAIPFKTVYITPSDAAVTAVTDVSGSAVTSASQTIKQVKFNLSGQEFLPSVTAVLVFKDSGGRALHISAEEAVGNGTEFTAEYSLSAVNNVQTVELLVLEDVSMRAFGKAVRIASK